MDIGKELEIVIVVPREIPDDSPPAEVPKQLPVPEEETVE